MQQVYMHVVYLCSQVYGIRLKKLHFYFILARIADLLSVFWNRARISCLSSSGVNSCASGPLPSAHLSSMSLRLAPRIRTSSLNFCHRFTNWYTLPGS